MSAIPSRILGAARLMANDVTALIPDFPFHYGKYLAQAAGNDRRLGTVDAKHYGTRVLIVGAGVAGLVAAYEAMRLGLHPVVVEATDRVGGRFYSVRKENPDDPAQSVICELGAMRFPRSGKALLHYFDKVGMTSNSTDFPNPGSAAAVSTVVDFREEQTYYETGTGQYPRPPVYERIESDFFDVFLETDPIRFKEMEGAMSEGSLDQDLIKTIWNNILRNHGWDNLSFHAAMVEQAKWSDEDITLFGQIGFGTGGWNTDYPNCFLEVLRVLYTGLDTNHLLMYDGCATLPERLWEQPPRMFGDTVAGWGPEDTVQSLTRSVIADPFNKEVRHIARNQDGTFDVSIHDRDAGSAQTLNFTSVVYTPHVRVLDKLRYAGGKAQLGAMNGLLSTRLWEAVMYTHYMQSAKIFASTQRPFWNDPAPDGQRAMSVTLSDRLTRGTYLLDYAKSLGPYKGSGLFLSYTWNDDSLKFLGDRSALMHSELCTALLDEIYVDKGLDLGSQFSRTDPFVELNWEEEPFFLGAFKMNLPGQYEFQRRLFSQFMNGVDDGRPDGFILAGDDISWTGGWGEGAVTSALNAVNKLMVKYDGASITNNPGPIEEWERLKPLVIDSARAHSHVPMTWTRRLFQRLRTGWVGR